MRGTTLVPRVNSLNHKAGLGDNELFVWRLGGVQ
jgi:hypothetical protein